MNLHLLDGSAYIHRAYYAWPKLTRKSDGQPTGAVLGFSEFLWSVIQRPVAERTHLAVVMDGGHSGRKAVEFSGIARTAKQSDGYKANRAQKDDDLMSQFKFVDRACEAFGVKAVRVPGWEADDVMATLAAQCSAAGGKTCIHSGDKDLMQLVDDRVTMFDPQKKLHIGVEQVIEKWSVPPNLVAHVQALLGDAVDGIPGVPKIGEKTAKALVATFGSLTAVLEWARDVRPGGPPCTAAQINNLVTYADDARTSLKLATLDRDGPGVPALDELLTFVRDYRPIFDFCEEMEFEDLGERISQEAA